MNDIQFTSVMDEIEALKKNFGQKIAIQSATLSFVTFTYERTPSAKVKATLTFPDDYPSHSLLVNIMWVPPGLQKKLQQMLDKVARELSPQPQMETVVQRLVTFMDTNRFVPCWKELRKVVDLIQHDKESKIAMNDVKGLIQLRLVHRKYFYSCSITIDPNYPTTTTPEHWGKACKLTVRETNFPPKIESLLTVQAKELVRRMQDGMSADRALLMSNPIQPPCINDDDSDEQTTVSISRDALKGLQHDVETMARVRDLRQVDAETKQGDARIKTYSGKERKDARRTIGKLTKEEKAKDEDWERHEQARMEGSNIPDYADSDPQPSLLSLVTFLERKIQRLPDEVCPICKELALPSDPNTLKALYESKSGDKQARKEAKRMQPIRTYCGCWYHYLCLDKFMTEPPFGAACPTATCGRRVYHPDWPADIKELERGWAKKQARQREIEDAAMFL